MTTFWRGSKYPICRFSLIMILKSLNFYTTFTVTWWHILFLHKSTLFKDKNLRKYTISYCEKNTQILKNHFLKTGFFQIPFLKFHDSISFWGRELGEVSTDSKFLKIITQAITPYQQSGVFYLIMSHIF